MNRIYRVVFYTLFLTGFAGSVKADFMRLEDSETSGREAAARLSSLCEAMFRVLPLPEWLNRKPVEQTISLRSSLDLSLPAQTWSWDEPEVVPTFLPPLFGAPVDGPLRFVGRLITGAEFEDLDDIEGAEVSILIVH